MATKSWTDLPPRQRKAILAVGALETLLTAAALRDLARRPADTVRGPKPAWAMAVFVQPVGPIAYFLAGRR